MIEQEKPRQPEGIAVTPEQVRASREIILRAQSLTPTEVHVLELFGRGKTPDEISRMRGIAKNTISNHVKSARKRLGVKNRFEAIVTAIAGGRLS